MKEKPFVINERLLSCRDAEKVLSEIYGSLCEWDICAVEAAEMVYNGAGRGAEKKAYVLDYLTRKGYKLDSDTIDKLIESAVLELKKG